MTPHANEPGALAPHAVATPQHNNEEKGTPMEHNDTPATDYSAFDALAQKHKSPVHHIRPASRIEGTGDAKALVITIPIREIQQAKPGTGQRKSLGFALGPIPFELNGGLYQLYAGFVALTKR